ncbi:hypothetical protein, partial [Actinomycetospora chlora]|uniref:hypothetical protein n=1 Tax=Actinomycetospora chlora TaxID=663608 RepID=UPI0031EF7BAB
MAGTHARSSGRRHGAGTVDPADRADDLDEGPRGAHSATVGGRRSRAEDRDRPEHTGLDDDYGDVVRARLAAEPAPVSPPVGFPSALSTGSFRSRRGSAATPPAEPATAADRGTAAPASRP